MASRINSSSGRLDRGQSFGELRAHPILSFASPPRPLFLVQLRLVLARPFHEVVFGLARGVGPRQSGHAFHRIQRLCGGRHVGRDPEGPAALDAVGLDAPPLKVVLAERLGARRAMAASHAL